MNSSLNRNSLNLRTKNASSLPFLHNHRPKIERLINFPDKNQLSNLISNDPFSIKTDKSCTFDTKKSNLCLIPTSIKSYLFGLQKEIEKENHYQSKCSDEQIDLITSAKSTIHKINVPKTGVQTFLNQKREILLIEIKIGEKKKKMGFFENNIFEKQEKIKEAESKMLQDVEFFQQYLDQDRKYTKEQLQMAEDSMKEKNLITNKLDILKEKSSFLHSTNLMLLEKLMMLYSYKEFLMDFSTQEDKKNNKTLEITKDIILSTAKSNLINLSSKKVDIMSKRQDRTSVISKKPLRKSSSKNQNINSSNNSSKIINRNSNSTINQNNYRTSINNLNLNRKSGLANIKEKNKSEAEPKFDDKEKLIKLNNEAFSSLIQSGNEIDLNLMDKLLSFLNSDDIKCEISFKDKMQFSSILAKLEEENFKLMQDIQKFKTVQTEKEIWLEREKEEHAKLTRHLKAEKLKHKLILSKTSDAALILERPKELIDEKLLKSLNMLAEHVFQLGIQLNIKHPANYFDILKEVENIFLSAEKNRPKNLGNIIQLLKSIKNEKKNRRVDMKNEVEYQKSTRCLQKLNKKLVFSEKYRIPKFKVNLETKNDLKDMKSPKNKIEIENEKYF